MSSGRSAGVGAVSYSMLAAVCAMLTANLLVACVFIEQAHTEVDLSGLGDHAQQPNGVRDEITRLPASGCVYRRAVQGQPSGRRARRRRVVEREDAVDRSLD